MVSRVHAAVAATEELARLLELTATEEATELLAMLEDDGGTTIVLDWLEDETATEDATELLLAGGVVPQPIG